jgi:hypothetical protein
MASCVPSANELRGGKYNQVQDADEFENGIYYVIHNSGRPTVEKRTIVSILPNGGHIEYLDKKGNRVVVDPNDWLSKFETWYLGYTGSPNNKLRKNRTTRTAGGTKRHRYMKRSVRKRCWKKRKINFCFLPQLKLN